MLSKAEQERKALSEQLEFESSVDYLSIELKAMEQLLKRELTVPFHHCALAECMLIVAGRRDTRI